MAMEHDFCVKGGMHVKGIGKQDPGTNLDGGQS